MKYPVKITKVTQSRISEVDFNNIPFGKIFTDHMFVADFIQGEWTNFEICPFGNLHLHPANLGIHYGQSIFEGMKACKTMDGVPCLFRPEMHAKRFNLSAERMCMPTFPEDLFEYALEKLIEIDSDWIPPLEGSALYIRPLMYACDESIGVRPSTNYKMIIFAGPVGPYYTKPLRIWVEEQYVRAVRGGVGEAKTAGNYAASLLPAKKAQEKGYDQVMWMDAFEFKYVQEAGTMNLFFVIDGKLVTPATEGTILKGITRDCILHMMRDKGYTVEERPVTIHEILDAHEKGILQEVFGAGTAAVVAPVCEIGYRDQVLTLPSYKGGMGEFILHTINGIRLGTIEDTYNWLRPVKHQNAVTV